MRLDIMSILNKWAEVVEYDKDQKSFNLLSSNYAFHQAGDRIGKLLEYDSTGNIAILYAKYSYESIMKDCKICLLDLMKDPDCCKDYLDMWKSFEHPDIQKLEADLLYKLNFSSDPISNALNLISTSEEPTSDAKAFSENMDQFRDSVEYVAEQLKRLRFTVFKKTDKPIEADQFINRLFVFNTIAECLLTIENRPDDNVIYLCYISDNNTPGAHFMYVFKSNGNLVSVGDRIDEAYVGAHGRHRNGRWQEDKCYAIFPYEEVMEFEGEDYKGYPKYLKCITTGLDLTEIQLKYRYRIIITAILLISRYTGSTEHIDEPIKYVHSILSMSNDLMKCEETYEPIEPTSLVLAGGNDIVTINNSELVKGYSGLSAHLNNYFNSENVASGELTETFNNIQYAHYTSCNQDLVDAFSEGFEMNRDKALSYSTKLITDNCTDADVRESVTSEYVADIDHIELEMYRQYRQQLADYVQDRMNSEYAKFGGSKAIKAWYKSLLHKNFDKLLRLAVTLYSEIESGKRSNRPVEWYSIPVSKEIVAGYSIHESADWTRSGHDFVLSPHYPGKGNLYHKCPISGCNANIWIQIQPCTLANLVSIIGEDEELPKIVTGWRNTSSNHDSGYTGNHILDNCDPVSLLRHPLIDGHDTFDFSFTIGVSKKGINMMLKELGIKIVKPEPKPESLNNV